MSGEWIEPWIAFVDNPAALLVIVVVSAYFRLWIPGPLHDDIVRSINDSRMAWRAEATDLRDITMRQAALIEQFIRSGGGQSE